MFKEKSDTQQEQILKSLERLEEQLNKAANEEDIDKIYDILNKVFGDRFPKIEKDKEEQENYVRTSSPAIIKNDGHSA